MWGLLNRGISAGLDALLFPLGALSPGWQLGWLALIAAVLALLVFRFTSNQDALSRARDRMRAHLLELWIYRDDLGVSARAQAHLFAENLRYLRHALLPLAVMLVPFGLLVAQIEARFAWRPLETDRPALLTVELGERIAPREVSAELHARDGLVAETPALRTRGAVIWRVRPRAAGLHAAEIELQGERFALVLVSGSSADTPPLAPLAYRASDPRALLYPAASIPAQTVARSVHVDYPARGARFAGLSSSSWLWLGLSLLFALLLRRPLGVTF